MPQIILVRSPVSFFDIIYDCVVGVDSWSGKAFTIAIAGRELIVSDSPMAH